MSRGMALALSAKTGVWAVLAYQNSRLPDAAAQSGPQAAQHALSALAAVNLAELTDEDQAELRETAMRVAFDGSKKKSAPGGDTVISADASGRYRRWRLPLETRPPATLRALVERGSPFRVSDDGRLVAADGSPLGGQFLDGRAAGLAAQAGGPPLWLASTNPQAMERALSPSASSSQLPQLSWASSHTAAAQGGASASMQPRSSASALAGAHISTPLQKRPSLQSIALSQVFTCGLSEPASSGAAVPPQPEATVPKRKVKSEAVRRRRVVTGKTYTHHRTG